MSKIKIKQITGPTGSSSSYVGMDQNGSLRPIKKEFIQLNDSSVIEWNYRDGYNANLTASTLSSELNISNIENGDYGTLIIYGDGGDLKWAGWYFQNAEYPTITQGEYTIVSFLYNGSVFFGNVSQNYVQVLAEPTITNISPDEINQGQSKTITVTGADFTGVTNTSQVDFGDGITVDNITSYNETEIVVLVSVDSEAELGNRNLTITFDDDQVATLDPAINILPRPIITSVDPNEVNQGDELIQLVIDGQYFTDITNLNNISFGDGITVNSVTVDDYTTITLEITVDVEATLGSRNLTITFDDDQVATFSNALEVLEYVPEPIITSVDPNEVNQGDELIEITVTGTDFTVINTISFGDGITIDSFLVVDDTTITLEITVDSDADLGSRTLTITFDDDQVATFSNALEVLEYIPEPIITSVDPNEVNQGDELIQLVIDGQYFTDITNLNNISFGAGITVNSIEDYSETEIVVLVSIDSEATLGNRTLTITFDDDQVATFSNALEINEYIIPAPYLDFGVKLYSEEYEENPLIKIIRTVDNEEEDFFESETIFDEIETFIGAENYLLYSQEFENVYWGKSVSGDNVSVEDNYDEAPDSTTTAALITATDTTVGAHNVFPATGIVRIGIYTFSLYCKAVDTDYIFLGILRSNSNYHGANFNLSNGTVQGTSGTIISSSIEELDNDWYRCSVTAEISNATFFLFGPSVASPSYVTGRPDYTSTGESVLVWGAQVNSLDAVHEYQPTTDIIAVGRIKKIYDQSETGNDAIQNTIGSMPIYYNRKIKQYSSFSLIPSSTFSINSQTPRTIVWVGGTIGPIPYFNNNLFASTSTFTYTGHIRASGVWATIYNGTTVQTTNISPADSVLSKSVWIMHHDGARWRCYQNGNLRGTSTADASAQTFTCNLITGMRSGHGHHDEWEHIQYYNTNLSIRNINDIGSELASMYSLTWTKV